MGEDLESDPKTLAVLAKALVSLKYSDDKLMQSINQALVEHEHSMPFAVTVEVLVAFTKLQQPFVADSKFWSNVVAKVPGSRMPSLCPALNAAAKLKVADPAFFKALVDGVLAGLQEAPPVAGPQPLGAALGLWTPANVIPELPSQYILPAFGVEELPEQLLALERGSDALDQPVEVEAEDEVLDGLVVDWATESPALSEDVLPPEVDNDRGLQRSPRWYDASSRRIRCHGQSAASWYGDFDASQRFARNRRGQLVADALEGLNTIWWQAKNSEGETLQQIVMGEVEEQEALLAVAASPVLCPAVQGLTASQLTSCAELYARQALRTGALDDLNALQTIVQEAVRKLSNFSVSELRRLHAAALSISAVPDGALDPYLERARRRRFPKALRKELRDANM